MGKKSAFSDAMIEIFQNAAKRANEADLDEPPLVWPETPKEEKPHREKKLDPAPEK